MKYNDSTESESTTLNSFSSETESQNVIEDLTGNKDNSLKNFSHRNTNTHYYMKSAEIEQLKKSNQNYSNNMKTNTLTTVKSDSYKNFMKKFSTNNSIESTFTSSFPYTNSTDQSTNDKNEIVIEKKKYLEENTDLIFKNAPPVHKILAMQYPSHYKSPSIKHILSFASSEIIEIAKHIRSGKPLYEHKNVDLIKSVVEVVKRKEVELFDSDMYERKLRTSYISVMKQIPKQHKFLVNAQNVKKVNARKIAVLCTREIKRALSKTSKTNPILKAKRINKDLNYYHKKYKRKDFIKKSDKAQKRKEEEEKEAERQKRKLNFLINQTELFSHFMLKKNTEDIEQKTKFDINDESKDFVAAKEKAMIAARRQLTMLDKFKKKESEKFVSMENVNEETNFNLKINSNKDYNAMFKLNDNKEFLGKNKNMQSNAVNVYEQKHPFLSNEHIPYSANRIKSNICYNGNNTYLNDIDIFNKSLPEYKQIVDVSMLKDVKNINEQEITLSNFNESLKTLQIQQEELFKPSQQYRKTVIQPKLLKATLKTYQLQGLNWLVSLYDQGINGILADDMGLGKTVQTISLFAYLKETEKINGPFLIVTPASTLDNWICEFNKFLPSFSVLGYYGSINERKANRKYINTRNVVITSYQIAVVDEKILKKVKWQYMVLDEAQAIKSSQSLRWQTLLNLQCRNRLLLTGTPIQNTMAELWALLHFIMPTLFDSHDEFNAWFSKDIEKEKRIDDIQLNRLHMILKPFMLRREKSDVKDELGVKTEKTIFCKMSHRQRRLYEKIKGEKETEDEDTIVEAEISKFDLEGPTNDHAHKKIKTSQNICQDPLKAIKKVNLLGLNKRFALGEDALMNIVMQYRKVCNHPDLFQREVIQSGFSMEECSPLVEKARCRLVYKIEKSVCDFITDVEERRIKITATKFIYTKDKNAYSEVRFKQSNFKEELFRKTYLRKSCKIDFNIFKKFERKKKKLLFCKLNLIYIPKVVSSGIRMICNAGLKNALFGLTNCVGYKNIKSKLNEIVVVNAFRTFDFNSDINDNADLSIKMQQTKKNVNYCKFINLFGAFSISSVYSYYLFYDIYNTYFKINISIPRLDTFISDSGKLSVLDTLLKSLKENGHRTLIYFQMTKMMDLMEDYLIKKGYSYLRLDGSSRLNQRRDTVREWQSNDDKFIFILSTRAGGLGINLTAADTVIFYDSDWNPTMDQQAMDRAHRLGQTKDVTVYRLVTSNTIEERIMERAQKKGEIQKMVIEKGEFKDIGMG